MPRNYSATGKLGLKSGPMNQDFFAHAYDNLITLDSYGLDKKKKFLKRWGQSAGAAMTLRPYSTDGQDAWGPNSSSLEVPGFEAQPLSTDPLLPQNQAFVLRECSAKDDGCPISDYTRADALWIRTDQVIKKKKKTPQHCNKGQLKTRTSDWLWLTACLLLWYLHLRPEVKFYTRKYRQNQENRPEGLQACNLRTLRLFRVLFHPGRPAAECRQPR